MTFNAAMQTALSTWFDTGMTEAVVYNGSSIQAHFSHYDDLHRDSHGMLFALARVEVMALDVSQPEYRDTVVYGGVTWAVQRIIKGDAVSWLVEVISDERPQAVPG